MIPQPTIENNQVEAPDAINSYLARVDQRKTRQARQRQRSADAQKAMYIYAYDNRIAKEAGTPRPRIMDYIQDTWVDGPRELEATPYAVSRFGDFEWVINKGAQNWSAKSVKAIK